MNKRKKTNDKNSTKTMETDPDFWLSPARLLGLSDAVISIAITILAIKLIPELHDSHGDLWAIRLELQQYAIGFLSLGILWIVHHHIFHIIKRADGVLVWLNIMFLGILSLGPFWTAFINKNPDYTDPVAYIGISTCLTFMILSSILLYATRGQRLISDDLDERIPWGFSIIILIGVFFIGLGTIVGFFNPAIFGILSLVSAGWFVYMTAHGYKKFFSGQEIYKESIKEKEIDIETENEQGSYWMSPERISVLTDGVVAIAITLMVLELPIPILGGKEDPNSINDISGEFFLIGVGFLSLGLYWAIHNRLFHYIKRADGSPMWLNILFLAFASLVPFWVAYINMNEASDEAMFYYGVALTITLLTLLFIWLYATSDHRLVSKVLGKNIITGFSKFLVFMLVISILIFIGNIMIPFFKYGSWIFSIVFFIYMTANGYQRFIITEKTV
jgi:uncharacterized membrane protein